MVDMSPDAVTARLRELSEASRALVGKPGPQAVSMAPEAITARLREWAELTRMCLLLGRAVPASSPPGDQRMTSTGAAAPRTTE